METLIISDNQLSYIENGTFSALNNLKMLNLANNKLTNITRLEFYSIHFFFFKLNSLKLNYFYYLFMNYRILNFSFFLYKFLLTYKFIQGYICKSYQSRTFKSSEQQYYGS